MHLINPVPTHHLQGGTLMILLCYFLSFFLFLKTFSFYVFKCAINAERTRVNQTQCSDWLWWSPPPPGGAVPQYGPGGVGVLRTRSEWPEAADVSSSSASSGGMGGLGGGTPTTLGSQGALVLGRQETTESNLGETAPPLVKTCCASESFAVIISSTVWFQCLVSLAHPEEETV